MKWDVDLIQDPNLLLKKLKEFNIKNKVIKSIKIVGFSFNFDQLSHYVDDKETFSRYVEIDSPIIIEFEDGDRFEIDYSEGSTLKVGYNSLPEELVSNIGHNVDGDIIFSNCLGKKIYGFSIEMSDEIELDYYFTGSYGLDLSENQESYISRLKFHLTDNLYLNFTNYHDYGVVWVTDVNHHTTKIKWAELKKGYTRNN